MISLDIGFAHQTLLTIETKVLTNVWFISCLRQLPLSQNTRCSTATCFEVLQSVLQLTEDGLLLFEGPSMLVGSNV